MTPYRMVKEFHETYGAPISDLPVRNIKNFDLRLALLLEEASEYVEATAKGDLIERADALADLVYVAYGAVLTHGIPENHISMVGRYKTDSNFTQEIIRYGMAASKKDSTHTRISSPHHSGIVSVPSIPDIENALSNIIEAAFNIANELDVDLLAILEEVHRSNMSKLGEDGKPIYRESDQKVLKGPNFFNPEIARVIALTRYTSFYYGQPEQVRAHLRNPSENVV